MSPLADRVTREALERCDRETVLIRTRADVVAGLAPAWLVTLGIQDWEAERRILLEAADPARWPFTWRGKNRLPGRQGWPCRVVARGGRNRALVAFPDGFQAGTSRKGLGRRKEFPPTARGRPQGGGREAWPGSYGESGPRTADP